MFRWSVSACYGIVECQYQRFLVISDPYFDHHKVFLPTDKNFGAPAPTWKTCENKRVWKVGQGKGGARGTTAGQILVKLNICQYMGQI